MDSVCTINTKPHFYVFQREVKNIILQSLQVDCDIQVDCDRLVRYHPHLTLFSASQNIQNLFREPYNSFEKIKFSLLELFLS